jgi:SLT domain-containing protein
LGGLAAAAGPAVSAASDLNETMSKTSVIFGDADEALFSFAETAATSLGQTKQQALDAAATFGTFGKAAGLSGQELAGFSTDFTKLASDLSSFNNSTPQEAIDALGAALRGESEPLRRFGVLLSADAIAAEALRMGLVTTTVSEEDLAVATAKANIAFEKHNETLKKYGEGSIEAQKSALALSQAESRLNAEVEGTNDKLTAQQKTLATQSLIMNATKDAQGDFARTSDGLANSQRILTAQMKDLQANIGKILLPIVESAVGFFSDFTGVLAGNQTVMVVVIGVVAALATAIIAANIAMKIYTATTKAAAAAQALFNFIMSANPIALVIIAVAAFVAALIVLEKRFGIISKGFELFSDGFYRFIINPIKQAIGFISDLIGAFKRIPGVGAIGGFLGGINIPGFADGGIVTRPTLAMVGEKGPEAIVPLGRGGGVGGVTVNVTGGLATSAEIGQAVVNAIRAYNRSAGPAQIQVA